MGRKKLTVEERGKRARVALMVSMSTKGQQELAEFQRRLEDYLGFSVTRGQAVVYAVAAATKQLDRARERAALTDAE